MASNAILDHEESWGLGNSFAKSGTAAPDPWIANSLQVMAFWAAGASDRNTCKSRFSSTAESFGCWALKGKTPEGKTMSPVINKNSLSELDFIAVPIGN